MAGTSRQKQPVRARLFKKQGGKCYYCAHPVVLRKIRPGEVQPANLATLDHVEPLSTGGEMAPTRNCVVACRSCNERRGAMPFERFRALVQAERG